MKKFLLACTLVSINLMADEAVDQHEVAWMKSAPCKAESKKPKKPTPDWKNKFCDHTGRVKVEVEYLYWATNYNLPFSLLGAKNETQSTDSSGAFPIQTTIDMTNAKVVRSPLKWSSGVRGTLGYTSHNDHIDIQAAWTYYQNKAKGSAVGSNNDILGNFTLAREGLKLTHYVGDLVIGKTYFFESKVLLRPFVGIRGAWFDQDSTVNYNGTSSVNLNNGTNVNEPVSTSIKLDQDIWCVGPRVGVDTSWFRASGFSIMANLSASLLYGKAHQKLNLINNNASQDSNNGNQLDLNDTTINAKDKFMALCPELQAFIGLSWERCTSKNRAVKLFAGWESNFWWEVSNILFFDRPISMQGLTAGLEVNF